MHIESNMTAFRRIACGISGGVDSAVAALLLKEKGYEVLGIFMKNWDVKDETGHCNTDRDQDDAEYICKKLYIPFHEVNFVKEYWNNVFSELIHDYTHGLTPNPDIICNQAIKFDAFYKHAVKVHGADAIATGHYANTSFGPYLENSNPAAGVKLLKAADGIKDQTFFLSRVPQAALQRTMFPLSNLIKSTVKGLALQAGLEKIVRKRESVGICFIGRRNFQSFIKEYLEPQPGSFIHIETGEVVGHHQGIHFWTVGQRCHIPGKNVAYFIAEKIPASSDILVAPGTNHPSLFSQSVVTEIPYWIHSVPQELATEGRLHCSFRFQNRDPLISCTVSVLSNNRLLIDLPQPLRALTPGQFSVLYLGNECLGSARIIRIGPSLFVQDQDVETQHKSLLSLTQHHER